MAHFCKGGRFILSFLCCTQASFSRLVRKQEQQQEVMMVEQTGAVASKVGPGRRTQLRILSYNVDKDSRDIRGRSSKICDIILQGTSGFA